MLERMIPGTIQTQETGSLAAARGRIDPGRLDRRGNKIRIRSASTAIDVRHPGDAATADHAIVSYVRDGKLRRVRAKAVVMASGGWGNRNIVADMTEGHSKDERSEEDTSELQPLMR